MSTFDTGFRFGFLHGVGHEQVDRERLAFLNRPPAPNPPALVAPTRCRVLVAFCVAGERIEPGEIVTLQKHDADSMRALGRVEILS